MKDIELPPLPDPKYIWHDADDPGEAELFEFEFSGAVDGRCDICERLYSGEQMSAYARAAVEADRAQRVPDGWKLVPVDPVRSMVDAAERVDWADSDVRGNIYNMWNVMLASTPAPAQQEQSEAEMVCAEAYQVVGCLLSDLGLFETEAARKILDNLSEARRVHQDVLPWEAAAQHQEPPQQERKPMTHIKEQARSYQVAQLAPTTGMVAISSAAYIELYERHHGIKE